MSDATKVFRELIDAYDAGELALFADAVVRARESLAKPATVAQTDATALLKAARTELLAACDAADFMADETAEVISRMDAYLAAAPTPTDASCAECGKRDSDGWALYCVACAEKALAPKGKR